MPYGTRTAAQSARNIKSNASPHKSSRVPMDSFQKKQLTFAKTADIPLHERPSLPTRTIEVHEAEVLPSSWVAEASEAVEADSAEEASVEVASEAVEPEADFKVCTSLSS